MRTLAALIPLLLASVAWAAPPELKVTHTEVKVPGDILRITAASEGAKSTTWKIWADIAETGPTQEQIDSIRKQAEDAGLTVTEAVKKDATTYHMACDGGTAIDLPTWKGQEWIVFVCVSNETGEQSSELIRIQCPGEKPDPKPDPDVPDPPDPPDPDVPLTGLSGKVSVAVKAVPAAHAELKAVASAYEAVAGMAETGLVSDPDAVVNMTKTLSNAALPTQLGVWQKIVTTVIGPHLNALSEAGKLDTAADHAGPWREIAQGLRGGSN